MIPVIERLALRLASAIKEVDPERTPSVDVMKFSLIILLHTLFTALIILTVGWATGKGGETAGGMLFFMLLRFFSGGYHLHSSALCTVLSVALIGAAPHIPLPPEWVMALTALNVVLMLVFAPSNIKGFARIPETWFPLLKIVSGLIVSSNFLMRLDHIAVVSLFQALLVMIPQKGGDVR
jgi:accessory gene regulator B